MTAGPLSHEVTLEMAARDTPFLRANLNHFEDEMEELSSWIEDVSKGMKAYNDELSRMNDVTLNLIGKVRTHRKISLIDSTVVNTFADSLQTICALKAKLIDDLQEHLFLPLNRFAKDDLREMKDLRRSHERLSERYDTALVKYAALPKTKEPSALEEDAFILYEARKPFIKSCLDYSQKIVQFKHKLEILIVDEVMAAMYAQVDFYDTSSDVFRGLKPSMDALKARLKERRKSLATEEEIQSHRMQVEEHALSLVKPALSTSNTSNRSPSPLVEQSSGSLLLPPLPNPQIPLPPSIEREGYLFKRSPPKPLVAPVWTRRYFMIKNGQFSYASTQSHGKYRGAVMRTNSVNVLLCHVRIDKKEERRFCFEVYTAKKSFMLQAESEKEVQEWISTFEAAKAAQVSDFATKSQLDASINNGLSYNPDLPLDPHDDPVYQAVINTPNRRRERTMDSARLTEAEDEEGEDVLHRTPTKNGQDEEEEDNEEAVVVNIEEDGANAQSSKTADGRSEDAFVDGSVEYPDATTARRNKELHNLLKSVPASDYVIDAFACALQKDIAVQGKAYATQNRICFYSNILGFVNVLVIHWDRVTSISRLKNAFLVTYNIQTVDSLHQLKIILKDDMKMYNALNTIWQNAVKSGGSKSNRMTAQALFDTVYATYHRNEDRGETDKEGKGITVSKSMDNLGAEATGGSSSSGSPRETAAENGEVKEKSVDEFELPASIPVPASPHTCACLDHFEKKEAEIILPVSAKRLYHMLFVSTTTFDRFHAKRGETNRVNGEWVEPVPGSMLMTGEPGNAVAARLVKFTMPMNQPMVKAKEAEVDEKNYITKRVEHFIYVVETRNMTPTLPYGDTFSPQTRYCITWNSKTSCKLVISTGIRWFKSPLIKSIIKAEAAKGLAKGALDILEAIKAEVEIYQSQNPASGGGVGIPSVVATVSSSLPSSISSGTAAFQTSGGAAAMSLSTSSKTIEASVLPFNLSKSWWFQWGLVALLGLQCVWTGSSYLVGRSSHTRCSAGSYPGSLNSDTTGSGCVVEEGIQSVGGGIDWGMEFDGSRHGLGKHHQERILEFFKLHYITNVDLPSSASTNKTARIINTIVKSGRRRISEAGLESLYASRRSKIMHDRLSEIHETVQSARSEARKVLRWLEEVEKSAVWAEYWQWMGDGVGGFGEGERKDCRGGCERYWGLVEETKGSVPRDDPVE
ncbi:SNF1-interacting protein [Chytridiales sp. JEL 0842]|nr:SNF1-interacting protein [Chytridiales sp. JEL 0842]